MNITALLVHFMKFMCTSFPACEWTTERWTDEQIDERRAKGEGGGMFIRYAIWKFICASNDWVIICGTFILSTENKSFLICCFFSLQFSILCLVCACVEVDCLFFQNISISIIFNSLLLECATKSIVHFFVKYIDYLTSGFLFDFTFLVNGLFLSMPIDDGASCKLVWPPPLLPPPTLMLMHPMVFAAGISFSHAGFIHFINIFHTYIDYQRAKTNFQSFKTGRKLRRLEPLFYGKTR